MRRPPRPRPALRRELLLWAVALLAAAAATLLAVVAGARLGAGLTLGVAVLLVVVVGVTGWRARPGAPVPPRRPPRPGAPPPGTRRRGGKARPRP